MNIIKAIVKDTKATQDTWLAPYVDYIVFVIDGSILIHDEQLYEEFDMRYFDDGVLEIMLEWDF